MTLLTVPQTLWTSSEAEPAAAEPSISHAEKDAEPVAQPAETKAEE
jgi:hypothetical protein